MHNWERWSPELLNRLLFYPVLASFRSQHENHSWLAALTTALDVSALVIAGMDGIIAKQTHHLRDRVPGRSGSVPGL